MLLEIFKSAALETPRTHPSGTEALQMSGPALHQRLYSEGQYALSR